jgi:hypothetical protein
MELEVMVLSKINQTQKDNSTCFLSYVEAIIVIMVIRPESTTGITRDGIGTRDEERTREGCDQNTTCACMEMSQ